MKTKTHVIHTPRNLMPSGLALSYQYPSILLNMEFSMLLARATSDYKHSHKPRNEFKQQR